jgi:hypothetical protein
MPYVAAHVQGNVGTSDALYTAVVGVVSLWVLASSNGVAAAFPVTSAAHSGEQNCELA